MTRADTVSAIVARNHTRGLGIAFNLGSPSPEDTVQDASLLLWRLPRIADDPDRQDGLWLYLVRLALMHERRYASWPIRAGTASNLDTTPQHLLPRSPSAESVALRNQIEPRLLEAVGRMMPSDRARFARRLADWKRHTEPFAPAIRALEQSA